MVNEYYPSINPNSSIITKLLYHILIFIMSIMHVETFMKIRCLLLGINIFEFIPEIRKFANTCSENADIFTFIVNSILCGVTLICIEEQKKLYGMIIGNILFMILYPMFFDYFYHKEKLFMKGMWDVPELTSFN